MSQNNNLTSALRGFFTDKGGGDQKYQALAGGSFNALASGGFAAYVLFWIEGRLQQLEEAYADTQFLWGNLDGADAGWELSIEPSASSQPELTATVITAGGALSATFELGSAATTQAAYTDRLILATLLFDGGNLALAINGSIVATSIAAPSAYVGSGLNAALGGGAPVNDDTPASFCAIVSAGHTPLALTGATMGGYAAEHYNACREAYAGGYLVPSMGIDWPHRYEAANAAFSATPSTITKSSEGAVQSTTTPAPDVIGDVGNLGPGNSSAAAAAPLSRVGALDGLEITQRKNMDWYASQAFVFVPPIP